MGIVLTVENVCLYLSIYLNLCYRFYRQNILPLLIANHVGQSLTTPQWLWKLLSGTKPWWLCLKTGNFFFLTLPSLFANPGFFSTKEEVEGSMVELKKFFGGFPHRFGFPTLHSNFEKKFFFTARERVSAPCLLQ